MLMGETTHAIDSKNRIFIPAKHREELGDTLIISRDIRGKRLKVYSVSGWEAYVAPIKAQERKVAEKALRYLHRNAAQVIPDSQGRVIIPQALIDYAEIKKNAVVVGCDDYDEIWAEELWLEEISEENSESIRADLEKYGL